jgi:hypothetical protein
MSHPNPAANGRRPPPGRTLLEVFEEESQHPDFRHGYERAERDFYAHEGDAAPWHYPNPFPRGTQRHAGYEVGAYVLTQQ